MKIENARLVSNCIPFDGVKLEIRLEPVRIVRFSLPNTELDRMAMVVIRCPGLDAPAFFVGTQGGVEVTGSFAGGKMLGVNRGKFFVSYEIEPDNFQVNWSSHAEPGNAKGGTSEDVECGAVDDPVVADASESSAAVETAAVDSLAGVVAAVGDAPEPDAGQPIAGAATEPAVEPLP
jgi:hypothetical protein